MYTDQAVFFFNLYIEIPRGVFCHPCTPLAGTHHIVIASYASLFPVWPTLGDGDMTAADRFGPSVMLLSALFRHACSTLAHRYLVIGQTFRSRGPWDPQVLNIPAERVLLLVETDTGSSVLRADHAELLVLQVPVRSKMECDLWNLPSLGADLL